MPPPIKKISRALKICAASFLFLCSFTQISTAESLTVALYPYVPRIEQFKTAITEAWAEVQPKVPLTFLPTRDWDGGYTNNPPDGADVFVFDAMYLALFKSQNNLVPFSRAEVDNIDDFLSYAIQGASSDNDILAIPLLGCANILFYQKNDAQLAQAATLTAVTNTLNQCTFTSIKPPDRRGIMIDMAGGTTNAALYADIDHAITGIYPLPQPPSGDLDEKAIATMKLLFATSSYYNATADTVDAYARSAWFSQGFGRSVVGFTESMSEMSPQTLENTAFKVMPLSDNPSNRPLFYSDMIGVNTATSTRGMTALAKQLANVMASSATVVASFAGTDAGVPPQYLMPARPSVFNALAPKYPIYGEMFKLTQTNPILFALNADARNWVNSVKDTIKRDYRLNYQCGCDYSAGQVIANNSAAPAICNPICSRHAGWNGNWTNASYTGELSVCQCNACPLQTATSVSQQSASPMSRRPAQPSKP